MRKNETKIVLKYSEEDKGTENSPYYTAFFFLSKKGAKKPTKSASFISLNELIT